MGESLQAILLPYQERIEKELREFARFPESGRPARPHLLFFHLAGKAPAAVDHLNDR